MTRRFHKTGIKSKSPGEGWEDRHMNLHQQWIIWHASFLNPAFSQQKYRPETTTEAQGHSPKVYLIFDLEFSNQILLDMWKPPKHLWKSKNLWTSILFRNWNSGVWGSTYIYLYFLRVHNFTVFIWFTNSFQIKRK